MKGILEMGDDILRKLIWRNRIITRYVSRCFILVS